MSYLARYAAVFAAGIALLAAATACIGRIGP